MNHQPAYYINADDPGFCVCSHNFREMDSTSKHLPSVYCNGQNENCVAVENPEYLSLDKGDIHLQDAESIVFDKLNLASSKVNQTSSATRKRLICCVLPIVLVILILTIATGNNSLLEFQTNLNECMPNCTVNDIDVSITYDVFA